MVQLVVMTGLTSAVLYIVIASLAGGLGVGTFAAGVVTGGLVCLGGLSAVGVIRVRRRRR